MSLDPTWLFLSLISGGIGFVLFVYGKKQQRWPQLAAGLVFMAYPYFATSLVSLVLVVVFFGLELFVGLVQAFVFFILSLAFFHLATEHHGDH